MNADRRPASPKKLPKPSSQPKSEVVEPFSDPGEYMLEAAPERVVRPMPQARRVREFLWQTYRKRGTDGLIGLLGPKLASALCSVHRSGSLFDGFSWPTGNAMLVVVLAVFAVMILMDLGTTNASPQPW